MNTIIIDGLAFSLPLFIMAVGGIYSEKSGVTNLALEGLQGFGAFVGALVAVLGGGKNVGKLRTSVLSCHDLCHGGRTFILPDPCVTLYPV